MYHQFKSTGWEHNIIMTLEGTELESVSRIQLVQDRVGIAKSVQQHSIVWSRDWTVQGSNPGGGEIFHSCPHRPWCSGYTIRTGSFRGQSDRGVALTTHPYLKPRLMKEQSYTSTLPPDLEGKFQGELLRLCVGFETRHGQQIFSFPDQFKRSLRPNYPLVQGGPCRGVIHPPPVQP